MLLRNNFQLNKWFLDFIGPDGEIMIFYNAKLRWMMWEVPYASWLYYDPRTAMVKVQSKLSNVNSPNINIDTKEIVWSDDDFGIKGSWQNQANSIQARLYESNKGYLDWNCYQPKSKVELYLNNSEKRIFGSGYAEELVMTITPWYLPMDELRWGHYYDDSNSVVWIQMKGELEKKWLWINSELQNNVLLADDMIKIPEKSIEISLKKLITLEAEKKISVVLNDLLKYIPKAFKKIIPSQFLSADEFKWFSNAVLHENNSKITNGVAIHEFVKFR